MAISRTDLPLNVLTEILARLPLKSLLVAKCLCKTFLHLASPTPYFNALQSAHPSPVLIFQFLVPDKDLGLNTLLYILDPENELDGASQILDVPDDKPFRITESPPDSDTFYSLKNSCNGLLLFCKDSLGQISDIMVCNPITNEYIMIGDEAEAEDEDLEVVSLLLGNSSVSNQYKIIKTSVPRYYEYADQYEDEDEDEDEDANYCQAEVFELGCQSKSWRLVAQPDTNFIRCDRKEIFLDGVIYCMNYIAVNDTIGFLDVEREEFGQIKLPDWDNTSYNQDDVSQYRNLGVVGACVCLIYEYHFTGGADMVLWVLKKSGNRSIWSKNAVVRTRESCSLKPLQVMRNGEILFVNSRVLGRDAIVCYNPKDASLREVKVKMKCAQIPKWDRVVNLIPNFVSLKNALKIDRKGFVNSRDLRERHNGGMAMNQEIGKLQNESARTDTCCILLQLLQHAAVSSFMLNTMAMRMMERNEERSWSQKDYCYNMLCGCCCCCYCGAAAATFCANTMRKTNMWMKSTWKVLGVWNHDDMEGMTSPKHEESDALENTPFTPAAYSMDKE